MKTQKVFKSPAAKQMYDLRIKSTIAIVNGRCRAARNAQKEYAKIAVKNFGASFDVPKIPQITYPLFSRAGLNTLKFFIFKAFSKKSPEEKQLREMKIDYYDSLTKDVYQ